MSAPTIYVDLIEEKPTSFQDFAAEREEYVSWQGTDHEAAYREYLDRFQPWHAMVSIEGNHKDLFRSTERYFNEADARHAVEIAFGNRSNVFLRQAEHGNVELRLASDAPQ